MARTINCTAPAGARITINISPRATSATDDDFTRTLDYRIRQICKHAEQYMHSQNPRHIKSIAYQEARLAAMGLTIAEIYSFVNRAPVVTLN